MSYMTAFWILLVMLFVLLFLGEKVCFALGVVSIAGFYIVGKQSILASSGLVAWNAVNSFELTAIPMFIFMGELVVHCGLSRSFYKSASTYFSRIPGGFLQTNLITCGIFSAISGSSLATAAAIGSVSYKDVSAMGYDKRMILGTLGGGGALGILIPPSVTFLIYGSLTETSVSKLFMAGIVPGLLCLLIFMIYVMIRVTITPSLAPVKGKKTSGKEKLHALKGMFPFVFLIVVILGGIYLGLTTPTEAASISVVLAIILSALFGNLTWKNFITSCLEAVKSCCMIFFIVVGAKFFTYIITMAGISRGITTAFAALNPPPLAFFLFLILIYLVLGCLMDGTSIVYLTIPVLFPLVSLAGFDPLWFGVILVILVEVAMLTPPVGMNLFVLHGIAKGTASFNDIIIGCVPYIFMYGAVLVLLWFFPDIATWLPNTMA